MRAKEFIAEGWTARTVKDYFDSQKNNLVSRSDFSISQPFEQCIMFRFKTVPDLTRAFFRMAEYYEGYSGSKSKDISMADFLDNFVDRTGNVDYFKFWDGFNITDQAFESWLKAAGKLGQAEQLVANTVKKSHRSGQYVIIGVAGNNRGTDNHELFHALYYLRPEYRRAVNKLMREFKKDAAYKSMRKTLRKKLDYCTHVDEEIAAYLTAAVQLKMVFGVEPTEYIKQFSRLFKDELESTD